MRPSTLAWLAGLLPVTALALAAAESAGTLKPRDQDTPRVFPRLESRAQWDARARDVREQILVSCGLWPMPARPPLTATISGRIVRDGYSVERIHFETWPGFHVAGNLYRPFGRGRGPFPGVLNPHGHWGNGRLTDVADGSIPARCISFARQGMVALAMDMVGYHDTQFADLPSARVGDTHRVFGTNRADFLWNINLMGLQTWNCLRALDVLAALPDVDPKRLACTGASGGGTQTFILGALDDRLAAQAPVVMVSHSMQGGCVCENAPGLRVEHSNMEIAAVAAPRPQILVAASGDWTKDTLTVEGPAIEGIYRLHGAANRLRYVRFEGGHNYNRTSREAVYAWFGQWLLNEPDAERLKEPPYTKEPDADLRVFPDGKLPPSAATRAQVVQAMKAEHGSQWRQLLPRDTKSLARFREIMGTAWRHTLLVEGPAAEQRLKLSPWKDGEDWQQASLQVTPGEGDAPVEAVFYRPARRAASPPRLVVLVAPEAETAPPPADPPPSGLARRLLARGCGVLEITRFPPAHDADPFAKHFTAYNRTPAQQRVREIVGVCRVARTLTVGDSGEVPTLALCGLGRAGPWTLLAAPGARCALVADCRALGAPGDEALLERDLFVPGLRNLGTFEGPVMLAAPRPVLLHNTGAGFATEGIRAAYKAAAVSRRFTAQAAPLSEERIVQWLTKLPPETGARPATKRK